ncbi:DUF1593 domain-containing protein [candidate division KSB1 bacterium]|nr:DUF1593 domain-containing protein [candidate division KSB1 bacterium]
MKSLTISKIAFFYMAVLIGCLALIQCTEAQLKAGTKTEKPRSIITSDGEIDDECSIVRFLLYANEWDIEAIVTSSSQYHWQGHKWAGDDWIDPYLDAYKEVYPNLIKHDPDFPTPGYLRHVTRMGNMSAEGEMDMVTPGSQLIVDVLLDDTDPRPIWLQAWGGINTISRALKTIEEEHPERMAEVAGKIRLYCIFEQDSTFQSYILPHWGQYQITTIISDQFEAFAYRWKKIQPKENHKYFAAPWMKENILQNHGPLCSLYKSHKAGENDFEEGDFRSEGDSPAFLHQIVTGLRSTESPDWGGWGGRFVWVRDNTWLDPAPYEGYVHPEGRYFRETCWGRLNLNNGVTSHNDERMKKFFKPTWRWSVAQQNDWAARADWCVKPFDQANHPPIVVVDHALDPKFKPGTTVRLSAKGTSDPDGDELSYRWWQYEEADTYDGMIEIENSGQQDASFTIPADNSVGKTIHVICEVTDKGTPPLTRYQRVVIQVKK